MKVPETSAEWDAWADRAERFLANDPKPPWIVGPQVVAFYRFKAQQAREREAAQT